MKLLALCEVSMKFTSQCFRVSDLNCMGFFNPKHHQRIRQLASINCGELRDVLGFQTFVPRTFSCDFYRFPYETMIEICIE